MFRRPAKLDAKAGPAEPELVMSGPDSQTVSAAKASEVGRGSAQKSRMPPAPSDAAAVVSAAIPASPEQKRRTPRTQKAHTDGIANAARGSAKASEASAETGDETAVAPPSTEKKKRAPRKPKGAGNKASEEESTQSAVTATDHVEAEGNGTEASAAKPKRKRTTKKTKTADVAEPSEDADAATAGGDDAEGGSRKPAKKPRAKKVEWPPGTYPSRFNATAVCGAAQLHRDTASAQRYEAKFAELCKLNVLKSYRFQRCAGHLLTDRVQQVS